MSWIKILWILLFIGWTLLSIVRYKKYKTEYEKESFLEGIINGWWILFIIIMCFKEFGWLAIIS